MEGNEYRANLAGSLLSKRDLGEEGKDLAKEQLDFEKSTDEYMAAEKQHLVDKKRAEIERKTKTIVKKLEQIESEKVPPIEEWGPDLGRMDWNKANTKIDKMNEKLKEGEKKWRLPTRDELQDELNKTDSKVSFKRGQFDYYWASNTNPHSRCFAYLVTAMTNDIVMEDKENDNPRVRCVR